jgi:hypothetical protein
LPFAADENSVSRRVRPHVDTDRHEPHTECPPSTMSRHKAERRPKVSVTADNRISDLSRVFAYRWTEQPARPASSPRTSNKPSDLIVVTRSFPNAGTPRRTKHSIQTDSGVRENGAADAGFQMNKENTLKGLITILVISCLLFTNQSVSAGDCGNSRAAIDRKWKEVEARKQRQDQHFKKIEREAERSSRDKRERPSD